MVTCGEGRRGDTGMAAGFLERSMIDWMVDVYGLERDIRLEKRKEKVENMG